VLQTNAFADLTFVFPSSAIVYGILTVWQSDMLNGDTYADGDNAIFGLYDSDPANLIDPPVFASPCDPFSEVMIIGFSSGGGLAVYSNLLHAGLVTKAVAIDYTPYHNWVGQTDWLDGFLSGTPASGFATNIYYSCSSDWYWLQQTTYGAATYGTETGLPSTYVLDTGYSYNGASYNTWTWEDATTGNYLKLRIVGLANPAGVTDPPDHCAPGVTSGTGPYPQLLFGINLGTQVCTTGGTDYCTASTQFSHGQMPSKVDIDMEIDDWLSVLNAPPPPCPPPPPPPVSTWDEWTCHDMPERYCCPHGTRCMYPRFPYTMMVDGLPVSVHPDSMPVKPAKYCLEPGDMPRKPEPLGFMSGYHEKFGGLCHQNTYREHLRDQAWGPEARLIKRSDKKDFEMSASKIRSYPGEKSDKKVSKEYMPPKRDLYRPVLTNGPPDRKIDAEKAVSKKL
jgi:hypothetical protein